MSFWQHVGFQDFLVLANSFLSSLHDIVMVWLIIIMIVVMILFWHVFSKTSVTSLGSNSMLLEVLWTGFPILILLSIVSPSIFLLCNQDLVPQSGVSLKLVSSQWSWQSEQEGVLVDHGLDFDKLDETGSFESPVVLPYGKPVRFMLTSGDVLHSLGVSSLGVKLDSIPGRLNAVVLELKSMGLILGSCYELCGSGHSAMPVFFLAC